MGQGLSRKLLRRLLIALAALLALPATAHGFTPGSQCHAIARVDETYAMIATSPARWTCGKRDWSIAAQRVFIRFDLRGTKIAPARFETRVARFSTLNLTTIEASGRSQSRTYGLDDMTPAAGTWHMSASLPGELDGAQAVVVRIDRPSFAALLTMAELRPAAPPLSDPRPLLELGVAAICGLLIGPLLFNLVFYRALREPFLLWQATAIAFMLCQIAIATGLASRLIGLPLSALVPLATLSFGAAVAASALFSIAFIERRCLDPIHRRAMRATAAWVALISLAYVVAPEALRAIAPRLYFGGFIPVLAVFAWIMTVALRRRSRAACFQLVAWLPIMLVGLARVAVNAFSTTATLDAYWAQHLSVVAEVLVVTLGVADRFMTLRIERDGARSQVLALASEAKSDALTGLTNRRALQQRFAALRDDGFTTMGVIDLDHFKSINDTHGHATGDAVLRAVAAALAPDADTVAVRYGGEEFILLLRGPDAAERAERRRAAIPARVAAAVPGLDRMVTASMGLVEQSPQVARNRNFAALFAHCDRLLYEAKHNGRNRTMSERLQVFSERRRRSRGKIKPAQAA